MICKIYYPRFTEAYYISLICLPATPGTDSESSNNNAFDRVIEVSFVTLALVVVMENERDFVNVILLYFCVYEYNNYNYLYFVKGTNLGISFMYISLLALYFKVI
jgi:hypothetical protein